jgi:hypothetical protein
MECGSPLVPCRFEACTRSKTCESLSELDLANAQFSMIEDRYGWIRA